MDDPLRKLFKDVWADIVIPKCLFCVDISADIMGHFKWCKVPYYFSRRTEWLALRAVSFGNDIVWLKYTFEICVYLALCFSLRAQVPPSF